LTKTTNALPLEDKMQLYFEKLRPSVSMGTLTPVMHGVQVSEPLERWRVATRIFWSEPLAFLGALSHGVYLFQWPLIVFFGDPKGAAATKAA